jgi:HEAT repeat protein
MEYPETFAAHFARAVALFADPAAKEDQKLEFRAVMGMVAQGAVTLVNRDDRILVNDVPVAFPAMATLLQRLREHDIRSVQLQHAAKPPDVFHLLRALSGAAERPVLDYLQEIGSTTVSVEIAAAEVTPAPAIAPAEPLVLVGPAIPTVVELLEALYAAPAGPRAPELLRALVVELETAAEGEWLEHTLTIAHVLVVLERWGGEGELRRSYEIAMRAVLARPMLERYARASLNADLADAAIAVLRRAGPVGTRVLLDLLAMAPTMKERKAYFHGLAHMTEGLSDLVHALGDDRWYVARNVADLCGELGLSDAVPRLGQLLEHRDARVRKSSAFALAQIGSGATTEFLRKALRDHVGDVRRQVPAGLAGRKNAAMAMPLAALLDEESDPEVKRELLHALGRIGTPDAVRALIKMAQPGGKIFGRRPTAVRLAAIDGLAEVGSAAAVGGLEHLRGDADDEVRAAVERALDEVTSREPPPEDEPTPTKV